MIPKIEKQQALGALKATGSSDPDVLFARKEELLTETRRMKILGPFFLVMGIVACLTIIGAVIGIPAIAFGYWVRKRIKGNIAAAEEALAEYSASVGGTAQAAVV